MKKKYVFFLTFYCLINNGEKAICGIEVTSSEEELRYTAIEEGKKKVAEDFKKQQNRYEFINIVLINCTRVLND